MAEDIFFYDSPENIKQCLNCTRTKCTNCLRVGGKGYSLKQDKIDHDEFMELYEDGWNDPKLAEYFGVTVSVIRHYRHNRGLKSKQPTARRKKNGRS